MHAALSGLNGVHCIADDILIVGSGDTMEAAQRDHDRNLISLLNLCREKGIKLNKDKLRLNRSSTVYMGHELTVSGLRPDQRKIQAILRLPVPEDKKSVTARFRHVNLSGKILCELQQHYSTAA